MGGKLAGHRLMITVPQEVIPDLKEMAELTGQSMSGVVRELLLEFHPWMKTTNQAVRLTKAGQAQRAANLMTAAFHRAGAEVLKESADAIDALNALQEPTKKRRKA